MTARLVVSLSVALAACATSSPEASGEGPIWAAADSIVAEVQFNGDARTEAQRPDGDDPATPEALQHAIACGLDAPGSDVRVYFDLTPTAWVPLASRLLACSPEAVDALELGTPDSTTSTATVTTYRRQIAGRGRVFVLAYDAHGVVGVSVGEEVPERLADTVFDLRSLQTREAAGGEPVPSPSGTLVFPATPERPFGVRLVSSPPLLVLSLVRE